MTSQDLKETAADGTPLRWAGPSTQGQPTEISIAIAQDNLPADSGVAPMIDTPFPAQFTPLLMAAEEVWETAANIQFVNTSDGNNPDIRVGVADLSQGLNPPTLGFIGYTEYHWNTSTDKFIPGTVVTVDNPTDKPVTALADGDFQYTCYATTVFQDFLHEIGHALGLAHNTDDVNAIMTPTLTALNRIPDSQDFAALAQLYGAPTTRVAVTQDQYTLLNSLIQAVKPA